MNVTKKVFAMNFRNFTQAREFARSLNLKNKNEWDSWCSENIKLKPKDIPIMPNVAYKNLGWISYKDWLGIK
tara:strand:- start:2532 stop:2747 length:216 start_codon:yes stop_codon:yes gene_type:complete